MFRKFESLIDVFRAHDESQPRDLRRATTLDTGSTLEQAA